MSIICLHCGTENLAKFRFCQSCGAELRASKSVDDLPLSTEESGGSDVHLSRGMHSKLELDTWLIKDGEDLSPEAVASFSQPSLDSETPMLSAADIGLVAIDGDALSLPASGHPDDTAPLSRRLAVSKASMREEAVQDFVEAGHLNCQRCGTELKEGHRFCVKCGSPWADDGSLGSDAGARRSIARVSFVSPPPKLGPKPSQFVLSHVNDDGSLAENIRLLEGDNVIGRSSSNALNADPFVSPRHMRVTCKDGHVDIRDLQSLNGVFRRLNNNSVTIFDGCAFRIGEELLIFSRGQSQQVLLQGGASDDVRLMGGQEAPGWGYLSLILGPYDEGNVYRLSKTTTTIGRMQGDIVFPRDGFVSGRHASLRDNGDSAILTDLDSSNGTFLKFKELNEVRESIFLLLGNQLLFLRRL